MGKLFPHPMGVFHTLLEPPKCHVSQKNRLLPDFTEFRIFFAFSLLAQLGSHRANSS